jgi:hypothetical protein
MADQVADAGVLDQAAASERIAHAYGEAFACKNGNGLHGRRRERRDGTARPRTLRHRRGPTLPDAAGGEATAMR